MSETITLSRSNVLLALQNALLGEVFPSMQAVDVSWSGKTIKIKVFVDEVHTDEDRESISIIDAEMCAHFPDSEVQIDTIIDNLSPKNRGVACVYARRPISKNKPSEADSIPKRNAG